MRLKERIILTLCPPLGYVVVKFFCGAQKRYFLNYDNIRKAFAKKGNIILAFWHNRFFVIPFLYRYLFGSKEVVTLISRSIDGEYLTRMLRLFKAYIVRGSTTEGGATALKTLVKEIQSGKDLCITPDGPRGPKYQVQPGTIALAKMTKIPILPVSYDCTRKKILKSWDNFIIPIPFGKMVFCFGNPIVFTDAETQNDAETILKEELIRTSRIVEQKALQLSRKKRCTFVR